MKPISIALVLFIAVLTLGSCTTAQWRREVRREHDEVLRAELNRHSDVLDLARTVIRFSGRHYPIRGSFLDMFLYFKPGHSNLEAVMRVGDGIITAVVSHRPEEGLPLSRSLIRATFFSTEEGKTEVIFVMVLDIMTWEDEQRTSYDFFRWYVEREP